MSALSERLSDALYEAGVSKRELIRRLSATGVPGSSEPAVYRYLRGENEPCLEFIERASEILNVPRAWLAFGDSVTDCQECKLRDSRVAEAIKLLS